MSRVPPFGYYIAVADDLYTPIYQVGRNTAVGGTFATLSSVGGLHNYIEPPAKQLTLSSDSIFDVSEDDGAWDVEIIGLDDNFVAQKERIFLNGITPVTTLKSWMRILRMQVQHAGAPLYHNLGNVYGYTGTSTLGIPDDPLQIYSKIDIGFSTSFFAGMTIPADCMAIMVELSAKYVEKRAMEVVCVGRSAIDPASAFKTPEYFTISENETLDARRVIQQGIPSNSDLELRARIPLPPTGLVNGVLQIICVKGQLVDHTGLSDLALQTLGRAG